MEPVQESPEPVEYPEPDAASAEPRRRGRSSKQAITEDMCAGLLAIGFSIYGTVAKPALLRPAWVVSPDETAEAAAPLARIANRLPAATVRKISNMVDPVLLGIGVLNIVSRCQEAERGIRLVDGGGAASRRQPAQEPSRNGHTPGSHGGYSATGADDPRPSDPDPNS